jgi:alpha-beta hydrolase superfamily lysophospholipase
VPYIHRWNIGRPKLLVHVVHGMGEHGARYARLAGDLNARGMAVWAHDHRGHGLTATPADRGHFGDKDGWRLLVDDAWDVSKQLKAAFPGVPLALFAHSMGSFVGQMLLAEHGDGYRAVVLCGTNGPPDAGEAVLRGLSVVQLKALGPRKPGTWVDALITRMFNRRFEPRKTDADWLSRDEAEVLKYVSDPLRVELTAQSWYDFLHGKEHLGSDDHVRKIPKALPILVIGGTHDPVGNDGEGVERLVKLYEEHGLTISHKLYREARHELVNETNRAEVTRDVSDWLEAFL